MRITDPSGAEWTVSRRWLPWTPRKRRITREDILDALDLPGDLGDDLAIGLIVFVVAVLLLLALPILAVLGLFAVEILLVLLLLPVFTLGRAVLVGRWPIDVRRDGELVRVESIRGWGASRRAMDELSGRIRSGLDLPVSE